ncbi:hypothetical protein [Paenibacillus sp. J45TS6]|uniref:hypothetical protein n=1 Tax=Paenibacillus sp. J45TS6 TaxID=2807196 RepID=UPI001BCD89AF
MVSVLPSIDLTLPSNRVPCVSEPFAFAEVEVSVSVTADGFDCASSVVDPQPDNKVRSNALTRLKDARVELFFRFIIEFSFNVCGF